MAAPKWQPEVVEETDPADSGVKQDAAPRELGLLLLALKTVSQRALAALADLVCLVTLSSVFYLWYLTPTPDTHQIVSLSIYALFILSANWLVRRK